jgi:hypothetical protein
VASERRGKDGVIRLMPCIVNLPVRPPVWRRNMSGWVNYKGMDFVAKILGLTAEEIQAKLDSTDNSIRPDQIRACYYANPTYTIEELAPHLGLTANEMREIVHGKSD